MKKILLSIFAVMLAVFSVQAEEVTKSVTFSNYDAGTQYAKDEKHDLGDGLVIYTTECHFTSELRIYSSSTHNGYVVSDALPGTITKMTFNAGNKADNLDIYGSNDGATWTKVGQVAVTSTSYKDYSFDFSGSYTRFKLDVEGSNQVRIKSMSVTYTTAGGEGGNEGGETPDPEEPEAPVAPVAPVLSDACSFDNSMTVYITNVAEGATAFYSLNNETDWVEGESVEITETTTVYAKVVKDELSSEVVSAIYTKNIPLDPNAKEVEATISFANTVQRVSQDSNSQVWSNEGVTFTNNKASSSSNVGNYSNPARLYAGSNVVVECASMTKILFTCGSTFYATALKNSIGGDATVSGSEVTVTFANPVNDFTVAKLTAQVRLNSLTVTYLTTQKVVKAPTFTPESCGFYAGEEVEVSISAEEGTIYYTLDGRAPTTNSSVYSEPFVVNETTTIKAIAVVDGTESEVATAVYTKGIEGTVTDAFDAYVDGERLPAVVTGYIVGYVNGSAVGEAGENCVFNAGGDEIKNTNILIANEPNETDYTKCLAVQLPNNEIRTALNLADNANNLNKMVVIKGSLEKYLGIAGLKDVVAGELKVSYTLSVSAAKWATLFLDFNAAIPAEVDAYAVTEIKNGYVTLTEVEGVLPANTGVLVNAAQGNYTFNYAAEATANVEGNLLEGTVEATEIDVEAYVLSFVDGNVGLYKAEMAGGVWLNNANKAYLPASVANGAASYSFRFEGGTTGISEVKGDSGNVKTIYDLTGRQVNAVERGIYIVNGKKVLVK